MKKYNLDNPILKKTLNLLVQVVLVISVVVGVTSWQTRNMLSEEQILQFNQTQLVSLDQTVVSLSTFINQENSKHKTLIYFFAPWCKVCGFSVGTLEELRTTYTKDELTIVMIGLDWQSVNEIAEFIQQHQITVPVLLGSTTNKKQFQISGYPSYYLLNNHGVIVSKDIGLTTKVGLETRLLLAR